MDCSFKQIVFVAFVLIVCVLPGPCASQRFQARQQQRGQGTRQSFRCNTCQPYWMSTLERFANILTPRVMGRVCPAALSSGFIGACDTPYSTCSTSSRERVNFCCCPASMLPIVPGCFTTRPAANICIPDNYAPWANDLQRIIFSDMLGK